MNSSPANKYCRFACNLVAVAAITFVSMTGQAEEPAAKVGEKSPVITLDVYKDPSCGCCRGWVKHMEEAGFAMAVQPPEPLDGVKKKFGIEPVHQSCHTAVSAEGYIFEGHVPARIVSRFLLEKPENAVGLAVPGMPVGSPGMEMGDRFRAYDVYQINRDGSSQVYTRVTSAAEQY
jgi:hypothetical protein